MRQRLLGPTRGFISRKRSRFLAPKYHDQCGRSSLQRRGNMYRTYIPLNRARAVEFNNIEHLPENIGFCANWRHNLVQTSEGEPSSCTLNLIRILSHANLGLIPYCDVTIRQNLDAARVDWMARASTRQTVGALTPARLGQVHGCKDDM